MRRPLLALALLDCEDSSWDPIRTEPAKAIQCELTALEHPLCNGDGCIFGAQGTLTCDDLAFVDVAPRGTRAPLMLLDAHGDGASPSLVDPITGTFAELQGVGILAKLAIDSAERPVVSYANFDGWFLRSPVGPPETVVGAEDRSFMGVNGLAIDGTTTFAVGLTHNEQSLVLATRMENDWILEDLEGAYAGGTRLAVTTESGRPLVYYGLGSGERWVHTPDRGNEVVELGGVVQLYGVDLIAGAYTWEAVFYQSDDHLGVSRRGHLPVITDRRTFPFMHYPSTCFIGDDDLERCGVSVEGVTSGPVGFRGLDGSLNAFVVLKKLYFQERYERPDCDHCKADFLSPGEVSDSALVMLRLTEVDGVERLEEVVRYQLGTGREDVLLFGRQRGDAVGIALSTTETHQVIYAAVDLTKL